jgi:hypothetical protein
MLATRKWRLLPPPGRAWLGARLVEPSQVMTKERLGRWFAGAPAG